MEWSQELKLLDRLSAATSTTHFSECSAEINELCQRMEDLTQGHFKRMLSDGVFARRLITAASSGLMAISATLESQDTLTRADSRCVAVFLTVVKNVVQICLCMAPRTPAELVQRTPAHVQTIPLLAEVQATIKQTDFLNNMAKACAALAAVIKNLFLQPRHTCPDHSTAAADDEDITAISSISSIVLEIWSSMGMVWGIVALGDFNANVRVPEQSCMHSWSDPQLQATIQSSFSLLKALIDLQPSCIHNSLFSRAQSPIWDAVFSASAYICSDAMAEYAEDQSKWRVPSDAALEVVRQTMEAQDVQNLQLFILAAAAGGLHSQQKGLSPMQLPESNTACSTADAKQAKRKQHKQQLKVTDCSVEVLQQLGLTNEHGQQLFKMFIWRNGIKHIDSIILNAIHILGHGSYACLFSESTTASTLPILRMKLVQEILLLMPDLDNMMVPSLLLCLIQTACAWNTYHLRDYGSGGDWALRSAAAAAVADDILAPLLLDVGPVVLAMKHNRHGDHCTSQWAAAVKYFWTFVKMNTPEAEQPHDDDPACRIWTSILQQRPGTATTVVEAVVRAECEEMQHRTMQSIRSVLERYAIKNTLELVYMMMEAVACNSAVQAESATAVNHTLASRNSSRSSSWPSFSNQSLAAKSVSLFISGLKFFEKYTTFLLPVVDGSLQWKALRAAVFAIEAAKKVVAAAAESPNGTAAAAVPWVYVAARALHCCATVLLSAEDKANMIDGRLVGHVFFLLLWPCLHCNVGWCSDQLSKLQSQEVSVSSSSSSGASASNARLSACSLPKIPVKLLQQQSEQLQKFLKALAQGWLKPGGVDDPGSTKEGWGPAKCRDTYKLAEQLQQYAADLCAVLPSSLYCNNPSCSNVSDVSESICVCRSKCSRCHAAGYCSKDCQKIHWKRHKKMCDWMAQ